MDFPLEAWYMEMPPVTRAFVTLAGVITMGTQLKMISRFQLYYNYELVFQRGQWWRLLTTFLYFGPFSLDWFFHMYFTVRYSRMLEEGSFRNKTADYAWFILYACSALLALSPLMSPFLGPTLAYVLAYVWSRREPWVRLNFLGLFVFRAPYLPWVLLAFTFLLTGSMPVAHLLGIAVGHVYHFAEDVWPRHGGGRWLKAPAWFRMLFPVDAMDAEMLGEEGEGRDDLPADGGRRLGGVAFHLHEEDDDGAEDMRHDAERTMQQDEVMLAEERQEDEVLRQRRPIVHVEEEA